MTQMNPFPFLSALGFSAAGATILMHQRNIDKCEFASCEYPLKNQIRLDKKMLAITVSAMLIVFVVLLPI